eukprot:TRINITY_DN6963_c0_g1_i1.p2 TRINITY_DN6963_c0_g1~~TRINITY_DN6963_c0_g1_i1.p2  ORF type:complete len:128 (+),score=20.10 TRINITY_DN6963_c0_g1_i1:330-713(+)
MDPGNWATGLTGGSQFGYTLLFVVLVSSVMAVFLQHLALRLGVAAEMDLAQACRAAWNPWVNGVLFILAEIAIAATDLAEVIGSAIALNLLFGLPSGLACSSPPSTASSCWCSSSGLSAPWSSLLPS